MNFITQNTMQFNFDDHPVRVLMQSGEPWFVAKDLCAVLHIVNSRSALTALDRSEKGVGSIDTLGGKQHVAIINESGMWTLILRCRDAVNPGTVPYRVRRWVTGDVLPSIRKTGSYGAQQSAEELLKHSRWILSFDDKCRAMLVPIPERCCVVDPNDLGNLQTVISEYVRPDHLVQVAQTAINRAAPRAANCRPSTPMRGAA